MSDQRLLKKGEGLAKHLALKKIHLWESKCSRDVSFKATKVEIPLEIEVSILSQESKNVLPYAARFTLIATDKETQKKAFEIQVSFCVVYRIKDDYAPTQEEVEAFGATSAIFNAWPYVREIVQSLVIRMDLPPFTLPPVTIGQLAKVGSDKDPLAKMVCGS